MTHATVLTGLVRVCLEQTSGTQGAHYREEKSFLYAVYLIH